MAAKMLNPCQCIERSEHQLRFNPEGPWYFSLTEDTPSFNDLFLRLEKIFNCLEYIGENKFTDNEVKNVTT